MDIESAKAFRDPLRNGESIYQVEVEDTVNTHSGYYDALTNVQKGPSVNTNVATAKSYAPSGIRDLLLAAA